MINSAVWHILEFNKCLLNKWMHGQINERINVINPKNPVSTFFSTKSKSELQKITF